MCGIWFCVPDVIDGDRKDDDVSLLLVGTMRGSMELDINPFMSALVYGL